MPVTLADLVGDRTLALRPLAGALDGTVGWVHVSELLDPTPYLDGGELLLTTGLGLRADTDVTAFVGRLADSGIAGLGFGVGLSHQSVPDELTAAARAAGLPLLEIPEATPFLAISKAVSAVQAADAYAAVTTTNAAQEALTKAAIGTGPAGVVRRLATLLDAWVLLLDAAGHPKHAAPRSAARLAEALEPELSRLRDAKGAASATFEHDGDHVAVQVLATRPRSVLAVGTPAGFTRTDQLVLASAAAMATLATAHSQDLATTRGRLRTGLLRLLLAGEREAVAAVWGPLPEEPVRVLAVTGPPQVREALVDALDAEFAAELDDHVIVVTTTPRDFEHGHTGVSAPTAYRTLSAAHQQAVRAADAAQRGGARVLRFEDLGGQGLLGRLPQEEARAFAESALAPLVAHTGRGDLLGSLREWLRHHGQWDAAAARLGVHRHTLRARIAKAADLLGRDLDSPGDRAELWLALDCLER